MKQASTRLASIAGLLAAILLAVGLVHLFILRFQSGDIYPAYSSLRSDPLGTKALYDSLAECRIDVSRNFLPIERLDPSPDSTLLLLGDTVSGKPNSDKVPGSLAGQLNRFVRHGGRFVVTLQPWTARSAKWSAFEQGYHSRTNRPSISPHASATNAPPRHRVSFTNAPPINAPATNDVESADEEEDDDLWSQIQDDEEDVPKQHKIKHFVTVTNWLEVAFMNVPLGTSTQAVSHASQTNGALPRILPCHTELCFSNCAAWTTLYERKGHPVMIERRLDQGTIVLSTVSYFLSNEALRDERRPELVAWVIGGHHRVVFDESHHNLVETPGLASLARRYNLQWLGLGLLILAFLFIWQSAFSLVPPNARGTDKGDVEPGKDSASGLVNILRRNVPVSAILRACVGEWKRKPAAGRPLGDAEFRRIDQLVDQESHALPGRRHSVEAYNEICRILNKSTIERNKQKGKT